MIQKVERLIFIVLFLGASAHAQYYAPETEFHDKSQRLFVVEAARVLAWRENLHGGNIAEVTYKTGVNSNRVVNWAVDCVDGQGKALRHLDVSYPESLLGEGPRFYRDVFKQIWVQGKWTATSSNLSSSALADRFWSGGESNGVAREDGLKAAFRFMRTNRLSSLESETAPELAGLLVNLPMPSLCGGFTLDAMLLARGAAWLALSESMLSGTNSAAEECWAPILFMSGRENAAAVLWKKSVKDDRSKDDGHVLFQWWSFFLSRPKARAAFEFAADSKQRRFGMPMMTYYSRMEYLGGPLTEVMIPMYGRSPKELIKLHNYGGFFAVSTDVAGGRLLEGAWPALFRRDWVQTLKDFPASPLDYSGHLEKLKAISPADPLRRPDADDLSLVNLQDTTPLLQMGYEQGTGKLIPVGVVTARDLLNYGWEMNGLQMGARYIFVSSIWGVHDLAETIYRQAMRDIGGQAPFFSHADQAKVFNLQETLIRLQMVDDLSWRLKAEVQPFSRNLSDAGAARLFYKRCWLRPYEVRWQAWSLAKANQSPELLEILRRYHAECGPKSDVITVEYLQDWPNNEIDSQPGLREFKESVAESFIEPTVLQVSALRRYTELPSSLRAQAYEKIFWQNPNCNLHHKVLNNYVICGAWKSATRFYKQMREIVIHDVEFSNTAAEKAWMIGYLSGDTNLISLALEDSDSGSYGSMMTHLWDGAAHDDWKKVEEHATEIIERYEQQRPPNSQAKKIKAFIPLAPALKNPKDSRHGEALDYFGRAEDATMFRWILIQQYKLSPDDAIRFLGGKETDRLRRVLVLKLQKGSERELHEAFLDYARNQWSSGGLVLASWMAGEKPEEIEESDLRVPGAERIERAVTAKLQRQ